MKQEILKLLSGAEAPVSKSVIAKALKVSGPEARAQLRDTLKALEKAGDIERKGGRNYTLPERLASVAVIEITDIDMDGDVFAVPSDWAEEYLGAPPIIEMKPPKKGHPAFAKGERILAKLDYTDDGTYVGQALKRLSTERNMVLGTLEQVGEGYVLRPVDKKARYDFMVPLADLGGAEIGDLVSGEVHPASRGSAKKQARIVEVLGKQDDPKIFSLVAIHERAIPHVFPDAVLKECEGLKVPPLGKREDLRDLPLVTIDGADARDFDDAVFAEADSDPKNEGGYHIIVAIADVAHYVRPGSQLDREALKRGNSTYFPDRVVPMLPEALSNDLCSLRPDEERAAMAMHMWIDRDGRLLRFKPVRALIKSCARLIYEQVQAARDGQADEMTAPLMDRVIEPLYAVYDILDKAREERGALDLDLPERQIIVNEQGEMTGVKKRNRLDAHKLIEEMMILANVATALALEDKKAPCLYRVHDRPDGEKLDSVRGFIEGLGLSFPKGQVVQPENLNRLLKTAKSKGEEDGIGLGQLVS